LELKSVFLKRVEEAFISQDIIRDQWQELNYLSEPLYNAAVREYSDFVQILKGLNVEIRYFSRDPNVTVDSIYCRDAAIATDSGMILCCMGKATRADEPRSHEDIYINNEIPLFGTIKAPGTLEGGDVAWLDERTLAVGHSYRTNLEGIEQLKDLLEPKGVEIVVVELPHYRGKQDVFHLMSILSPVDKDLAVVYSPLMPIKFRNELIERGFELIEVPDAEFESMGCNVLAIAPRRCLMVEGNPITKSRLEEAGCMVSTYKGTEISIKGGGGPTCLTRPLLRSY
jgi:N-dimethylarginine dimethylaminohydrolase